MVIFSRTYEVIQDAITTLNGLVINPQEKVCKNKILCKPLGELRYIQARQMIGQIKSFTKSSTRNDQQIFRNFYSSIIEPMSGVDDFTMVSQKHENEGVD